jgi:hypothetical protein
MPLPCWQVANPRQQRQKKRQTLAELVLLSIKES